MERATQFTKKVDAIIEKVQSKGFQIAEIEISPDGFSAFEQWVKPFPLQIQRHWHGLRAIIAFHPPGLRVRQFRQV